jgi:hypothetical protein
VDDGVKLADLIETHKANTYLEATTVVADSKYGTVDNFLACHDKNVTAHIKPLADRVVPYRNDIFPQGRFTYDAASDSFTCPAGRTMKRKAWKGEWIIYVAGTAACLACHLKEQCTKAKTGRAVRRHVRQEVLALMYAHGRSKAAKRNLRIRQHLMERSFAQGVRFGMKKARWRRLWRVQIQEYLIASVQNIRILLNATKKRFAGIRNDNIDLPGRITALKQATLRVYLSISVLSPSGSYFYFLVPGV